MKIKFDIDCTPEEARAFFGLPDVAPMQAALMEEVQKRMTANLDTLNPEALFKAWMGGGATQGMEQMQKIWAQAAAGMSGGGDKKS
ncbi:MAG: DUF6489 family protein [Rhodospirillales bacterium]